MKPGPRPAPGGHLSAEDFFNLALPPAGLPGALPEHLSGCAICARQLEEWRQAVADLSGRREVPSDDFESRVMARVRRLPAPRSHRLQRRALAGLAAAAALTGAFLLGGRLLNAPAPPPDAVAHMSSADRADDELLRDVSRLVEGEDPSVWKSLAPLPAASEGTS